MDHKDKIRKFYKGELSQDEAKEFLEFLESREAADLLSKEIIRLWSSRISEGDSIWDNKALWEKINKNKNNCPGHLVQSDRKAYRLNWLRAAVVFLVLGLASVYYFQVKQSENQESTLVTEEVFVTNSNPKGQKTKVMLEDGSQVYLNSQSSITYSKDFKTNRNIRLEGEAFFEVAEDKAHPFTVEANGIVTTALGTSFNITTFQEDHHVAVTLLTGKVKLNQRGKNDYLELLPGEESLLSYKNPKMEKYKVSAGDKVLWTKGVLNFEEASFYEMVEVLERWYAVDIKVDGEPKPLHASGVFDNQESLRNVLNVMSETLEFDFEIHEQEITIKFN